ncbi:MAG: sugar phosphate isomerase/epimerase [Chloroflexi bacterium]|nr:sugar phosphate isomerase/epimerase [Chloroflexota bacterium]
MLPVGLSSYSFNVVMGYARRDEVSGTEPWSADDLIGHAASWGFSSVELPVRAYAGNLEHARAAGQRLRAVGLGVVADTGIATAATITEALPIAQALGATLLRVTLSNILCGERRRLNGGWDAYLKSMASELHSIASASRDAGITIGVENHQDIDSTELAWLCEFVGPAVCGVCLDIANPLAVGEDIDAFTRRVAPYVRNVHLKDYRLFPSPQGYRLARCALGAGVLDWPHLFALLDEVAPACTKHVELGAAQARHIPLFEDSWWTDYKPRSVTTLLPVLRLREAQAHLAHADWRTPHERGAPVGECREFELAEMHASVAYLQTLFSGR